MNLSKIRVRKGRKGRSKKYYWWVGPFDFKESAVRYYGPYEARKDALEDKEGLLRFFKRMKRK